MKVVLCTFLGLFLLYAVAFVVDVATGETVDATEEALALQYLETTGLPTPPTPFYEDGCTAWPDYILWHDFYDACLKHDIGYWAGGELSRKDATDLAFYEDLKHTGPLGPVFAVIMYVGVHYGGNNFISYQLGSNWGYGWNEQ